jgi:Bacterial regulatory helix-turn-helix protein, lysR family
MQDLNFSGFINLGLKPKQLQLIVALDELRNISKVANYVKITQPAVSKSLHELEIDLGVKLFDRSSRGIAPRFMVSALFIMPKRFCLSLPIFAMN